MAEAIGRSIKAYFNYSDTTEEDRAIIEAVRNRTYPRIENLFEQINSFPKDSINAVVDQMRKDIDTLILNLIKIGAGQILIERSAGYNIPRLLDGYGYITITGTTEVKVYEFDEKYKSYQKLIELGYDPLDRVNARAAKEEKEKRKRQSRESEARALQAAEKSLARRKLNENNVRIRREDLDDES